MAQILRPFFRGGKPNQTNETKRKKTASENDALTAVKVDHAIGQRVSRRRREIGWADEVSGWSVAAFKSRMLPPPTSVGQRQFRWMDPRLGVVSVRSSPPQSDPVRPSPAQPGSVRLRPAAYKTLPSAVNRHHKH